MRDAGARLAPDRARRAGRPARRSGVPAVVDDRALTGAPEPLRQEVA